MRVRLSKSLLAKLAGAVVALSVLVTPAHARPAHAAGWYTWRDSLSAIRQASWETGVSYWWLRRVATCESGLDPYAYNPSGASGLFQFEPATWAYYSRWYGVFGSPYDPYSAALTAAYMFRDGLSYLWVCR